MHTFTCTAGEHTNTLLCKVQCACGVYAFECSRTRAQKISWRLSSSHPPQHAMLQEHTQTHRYKHTHICVRCTITVSINSTKQIEVQRIRAGALSLSGVEVLACVHHKGHIQYTCSCSLAPELCPVLVVCMPLSSTVLQTLCTSWIPTIAHTRALGTWKRECLRFFVI